MKPTFQKLTSSPEEGFCVKTIRGRSFDCPWHFHDECELILVLRSGGYRMLGDHIEPLVPGDLVLIGAQLPHIYQNDQVGGGRTPRVYAVLVQFEENFLGGQVTEMAALQPVRRLLKRARLGLQIRGKTFPRFVNELRIGRACRLLTEDELTVTEVAYACGFRNLSNFNRQFQRLKQATPREYRKSVRKHALGSVD